MYSRCGREREREKNGKVVLGKRERVEERRRQEKIRGKQIDMNKLKGRKNVSASHTNNV